MKTIKKTFILILLIAFVLLVPNVNANGLPYRTFTFNRTKGIIPTQDAYLPLSIQYQLGNEVLNNPTDITIDNFDNVYISDYKTSGNNQVGYVIKYNLEENKIQKIGEDILKKPTGIHVGKDNNLYVADNVNKKAYKFEYDPVNDTYSLTTTYEKPINTPYFSEDEVFEPTKIITDLGNVVYVQLAGNVNGLAKYENTGMFTGFFGGNQIPQTFENMIRSLFFNEQQRRDWFKMIPNPVYNIGVDKNGLILTTTKGQEGYLKLNIANYVYSKPYFGFDDIEDIYVGPSSTIYTVNQEGYITEYGPSGETLFIFSGTDTNGQKGLFKQPTGIAVDNKNNIYVIDNETKALQIFIPTDFANLVHQAIELYEDGKYQESLIPWQNVLKMNSLFDLANQGIADAYFAQGDYENAMISYEIARHRSGYSDAYWEVRNVMLLNSGSAIITVFIMIILLFILNVFFKFFKYIKYPFTKLNKVLSRFKLYNELKFGFYVLRHPEDGFYGIKRERKSSNLAALIYMLIFFVVYIMWIYNTSFLFNNNIPSEINFIEQVVFIFLPLTLWVIANYLVCSIRDGEGKLSDVFQGTAYILIPLIIALPILTLISNYLTLNESFIYEFGLLIALVITGIYVVLMVKEIHFYDVTPTIANIFITIFTAIMLLVFSAIIYLLLNEVIGLISDIIREVTLRG